MNIYLDTKTIAINLMRKDRKNYLSTEKLQSFMDFLYTELSRQNKLKQYEISFNIDIYSIERTVQYNNDIFELDIDKENLRLKKRESADNLAEKYQVDDTIKSIIEKFPK